MTIVFTASSSWISRVIRRITKSRASHVMIGCDVLGVPMLLHCTSGGVQFTPRRRWFAGNRLVAEYAFVADVTSGVRRAFDHLGERYDYVSLLGFVPVLFFRWLRVKIRNPLAAARAMVCSEFVLHVGHGGEIPEWRDLDYEATTPEDLLEICSSSPASFLLVGA